MGVPPYLRAVERRDGSAIMTRQVRSTNILQSGARIFNPSLVCPGPLVKSLLSGPVESSTNAPPEEVESSVILPPDTTSLPVQAEFIALDDDGQIKFEILARKESFNQTAVESCFIVM